MVFEVILSELYVSGYIKDMMISLLVRDKEAATTRTPAGKIRRIFESEFFDGWPSLPEVPEHDCIVSADGEQVLVDWLNVDPPIV